MTRSETAARRSPEGFRWGAATAGHQIEGNNVNSDLWFLENNEPNAPVTPATATTATKMTSHLLQGWG